MVDWIFKFIWDRLSLILVFLSGVGFSVQTLLLKLLAENGFHGVFQCIFCRGIVQSLISLFFIYRGYSNESPFVFGNNLHTKWWMFVRSFSGFGGIVFFFLAVQLIPLGDTTVLVMLAPLVSSVASIFILGENLTRIEIFAILLSLLGCILVTKPPFIFSSSGKYDSSYYFGIVFALSSAVFYGFSYVAVRVLGTTAKMPWQNVAFVQSFGHFLLAIPTMYAVEPHSSWKMTGYQFFLMVSGATIAAISQLAMTIGMQREKSATASAMRMSDVVFSYIWQILFTANPANTLSLLGAGLITGSILLVVVFKSKAGGKSQEPGTWASIDGRRDVEMMALPTEEQEEEEQQEESTVVRSPFSIDNDDAEDGGDEV